jgi:hypothetical protein
MQDALGVTIQLSHHIKRFEGNRGIVDAPWPLKSTSMLVEKLEKHAASAGGNFFQNQNHLIGMRFDKKICRKRPYPCPYASGGYN